MNIPAEITSALHDPATKKAWISEFPNLAPDACKNCGGSGIIAAFIATEGPYSQPASPYATRKNGAGDTVNLVSKTEIIGGQVRYWVGQTISVCCPDCQNTMAPMAVAPDHHYSGPKVKQLAQKFDVTERED